MKYNPSMDGKRVKINPESKTYELYFGQHKGNEGIIENRSSQGWVNIMWSDGYRNSYPIDDIIFLDGEVPTSDEWDVIECLEKDTTPTNKAFKKKREEVNKMYEYPLLPGERVCLNPETKSYASLKRDIGDMAGWVVNMGSNELEIIRWKGKDGDSRKNWYVSIRFDNGTTRDVQVKNLLCVDTPCKILKNYHMSSGENILIFEGESTERLDYSIIKYNHKIKKVTTYDDEWRKKIKERVENYILSF